MGQAAQTDQTSKNPKRTKPKTTFKGNQARLAEARKRKQANREQYPRSSPVPEVVAPDPHADLRRRMQVVLGSRAKYQSWMRPIEFDALERLRNKHALDHMDLQCIESILSRVRV
ncbi:hypothetical protein KBD34_02340 [Patescibacteria group bacterium]|nr:hypothetical protein [Patescibacteria group bacterium]